MKRSAASRKASAKWFWILLLIGLLVLTIAWFANPVEDVPPSETVDQAGQWVPPPGVSAVDVTLPETPLKNPVVKETAPSGD